MAFRLADDILRQGIQGISELITQPGLINVDFSHIKNMMLNGGGSLLAIGTGQGENRVSDALEHALHHPMLESIDLEDASGIIANFTGGNDLSFLEVIGALNNLQEKSGGMAEIIPGVICDNRMEDRVQVILVLTGIGATSLDPNRVKRRLPVSAPVTTTSGDSPVPASLPYQENIADVNPELAAPQSELDVPAFMRRKSL